MGQSAAITHESLINLHDVYKAYETDAGGFMALKGINLDIGPGEAIAVIGKSGSGKSTLINMITGIDRPTSGEVWIKGEPIHTFNENQMARWRGKHLGIVFQFFQLLPGLTILQNVLLPMDLGGTYDRRRSRERAMYLLDQMGIAEHAHKHPSQISGGQQQRVAIARALVNNPDIIVADEPTGSLDSQTAEQIFRLFEILLDEGKTILIVTHDDGQARRIQRTLLLTDGEIVNEWVAKALPSLSHQEMLEITRLLDPITFSSGELIIQEGHEPDRFYIVSKGEVHVYLHRPDGREVFVEALGPGEFFGEMALLRNSLRTATVRASRETDVELVALERDEFDELVAATPKLHEALEAEVVRRDMSQARKRQKR